MNITSVLVSVMAQAQTQVPPAEESSMAIDLAVWKYVIIIGLSAITILYVVKRIAEVVVKRKTATMIREVVGDEEAGRGEDWDDLEKLDKELDKKD